MMNIILSTRNPTKALEIKALFNDPRVQVFTLADAEIQGDAVEDGATLKENALKKARFAREHSHSASWAMADDTGIFINALNGEPGVYSARWAGENAKTEDITNLCLERLKGARDRTATFRTAVAVISPENVEYLFVGKVDGELLEAPRVPPKLKMPYSPLFVPKGETMCWAEMSTEYENTISHRGIAIRKAKSFLEAYL
jgi:XTP/dITP diphosphohydrolase